MLGINEITLKALKMISCAITFDNSFKVYSAGKLLRGNVHFALQEEKKVRGVYIRIVGQAYAATGNTRYNYRAHEVYLDTKVYLVGGPNGEFLKQIPLKYFHQISFINTAVELELQSGEYDRGFECMLPGNLPSSSK